MESPPIKLCVDCRHGRSREYDYVCLRLPPTVDPVTGALVYRQLPCMRDREGGACGPEGRFWEPRALRTNVIERIWRRLHGHSVSTQ